MKIIPKYLSGGTYDIFDIRDKITWHNDWQARDNTGRGLGNTYNNLKGLSNGRYDYDRKLKELYEDFPWYTNFSKIFNADKELQTSWANAYVKSSDPTNPYKDIVSNYLNTGLWNDTTGRFSSFENFYNELRNDRHPGHAHYTSSGTSYVDPSTGKFYKTIPDGYKAGQGSKEYINNLKANYGTGELINFIPIEKDTTPIHTKISSLAKENILNANFNEKDLREKLFGKVPEGSGDTIRGSAPWSRTVLNNIGQWIGNVFRKNKGNNGDKGDKNNGNNNLGSILNKNKEINPFWIQSIRTAVDNAFNTRNTERLINNMDVPLANYTPVYRQIHGDYIALLLARREASRFRTSQPITANQLILSATDLEGILKGNLLIELGNAKDAQMFWNTSEQAFLLAKENARGWDTIANQNSQRLSEFNNKIAELRYNTKKQNMQNWDTLLSDIEAKMWQKRNREDELREYHKEQLDLLFDKQAGLAKINNEILQLELLRTYYLSLNDEESLKELNRRILRLENIKIARLHYNMMRRYNLYTPELWKVLYGGNPDYDFDNPNWEDIMLDATRVLKLKAAEEEINVDDIDSQSSSSIGSTPKHQSGGSFGVVAGSSLTKASKYASPLYSTSSKKSSSTSSSSSDDDEDNKTRDKLLSNIAETIKGIDGLNSDVNTLYRELTLFFDIQRYNTSSNTDPMLFYSMYIKALNRVNLVKQSAKLFDGAYKELEKRDAMTSPAIDSNGYIFVGIAGTDKIERITPNEYLKNNKKYHLIRNNELLDLRRNNPQFAFSDKYITEVAYNGTNILDVYKFVKDILGRVGSDEKSQDLILKLYGSNAFEGLQTLAKLSSGLLSQEEATELMKSILGTMTEVNVSTLNLARQANLALATIVSLLPQNMKSLLLLHSGGEENVGKLLSTLIMQGLDTSFEFRINGITQLDEQGLPKSGTRSGNGSGSGGGSEEAEERSLLNIASGIGGTRDRITINPGTKALFSVDVENYIVDGIKAGNLEDALINSKIMTISDPRKIYFGDLLVSPEKLRHIVYKGTGFSRAILPVKADGSPDFTIFERFDRACQKVRNAGMNPNAATTNPEVAKALALALKELNLDNLIINGVPNLKKVGLFMLADGYGTTKGGIKKTKFVVDASSKVDYLDISELLGGKGPDGKYQKYELDDKTWYLPLESIFDSHYDRIYEGTIYIPISNNKLLASTGSGNKLKRSTAYEYEQEYLNWETLKNNSDNSKLLRANNASADKLLNK